MQAPIFNRPYPSSRAIWTCFDLQHISLFKSNGKNASRFRVIIDNDWKYEIPKKKA